MYLDRKADAGNCKLSCRSVLRLRSTFHHAPLQKICYSKRSIGFSGGHQVCYVIFFFYSREGLIKNYSLCLFKVTKRHGQSWAEHDRSICSHRVTTGLQYACWSDSFIWFPRFSSAPLICGQTVLSMAEAVILDAFLYAFSKDMWEDSSIPVCKMGIFPAFATSSESWLSEWHLHMRRRETWYFSNADDDRLLKVRTSSWRSSISQNIQPGTPPYRC